ncbi:MAG: alpha/beta fold hydrolase [Gammaproteobacteria bacterium]
MSTLQIRVLGELQVLVDGEAAALPASRKTRALLAYLALTARPHRRDRLCELLWEVPDDPRAALRWSLSKLRPTVNGAEKPRIVADRERVQLDMASVTLDTTQIADQLDNDPLSLDALQSIATQLDDTLLAGIDLPRQEPFARWLQAERQQIKKLAARAAGRIRQHVDLPAGDALSWSERWLEGDPYNADAARQLTDDHRRFGQASDATRLEIELTDRFRNAGVPLVWKRSKLPDTPPVDEKAQDRQLQARQRIQFCTAADGARIAYATVGDGPAVIKAANWLSHLALDWDAPIWSPLFRRLAQGHQLVRYDERGNGLSDWEVDDISFDAFMADLESVVEASQIDRFALLGISQGASVSIEYAVRYPERVSHLVLFGAYAAGWRIDADEALIREREAIMTLTETGWGRNNPAYRQIFSSTFMPDATPEEMAWFNEFQRHTTSPENASRFLSAFGDIDVRDRLAQIKVPTLVLHSRGDRRIPFEVGLDIAAQIPNAEFVGLESDGHLLLGREQASDEFVQAVEQFLKT